MQNQLFDHLSIIFSRKRLEGYLSNAPHNLDKQEALVNYSWNIELSQELYPTVQILEIALRNTLHQSLRDLFKALDFGQNRMNKPSSSLV